MTAQFYIENIFSSSIVIFILSTIFYSFKNSPFKFHHFWNGGKKLRYYLSLWKAPIPIQEHFLGNYLIGM